MSRTCIVVLTWNAPAAALRCLDSLLPLVRQGDVTLVVCDNGSEDDTLSGIRDWGRRHFDAVAAEPVAFVLIENGANLGYAAGNNTGIRWALAQGGFDGVWLLNQDCRVEAQALSALLHCVHANPDAAILGSTLLDARQPERIQYAGGARYFPLLTLFRPLHRGAVMAEIAELPDLPLDYVSGAAQYIRLTPLEEAGLLNEDLFLFYEELDLAVRLRRLGWRLHWCRDSRVLHQGAASTGARLRLTTPQAMCTAYHENLSTLVFTKCHYPGLLPWAASFRFAAKSLLALLRFNPRAWLPLWRAYRDFFIRGRHHWPRPEAEPRIVQCGRLTAD